VQIEFESPGIRCWHDGDGALIVSLDGERPTISRAVLDAYHRAIELAESRREVIIIGAGQKIFAFGADLGDELGAAMTGDTAPLDRLLHYYQQTMLALRHARVPTIAVSRGIAVSGGCEVLMHCTRVVAAPTSPIGLAEASIGVMPAGGGVKEMARRSAQGDANDYLQNLERAFAVLSGARIAYARDAKPFDLLTEHDVVTDSEDLLSIAKQLGHSLLQSGYTPPPRNPMIRVAGADTCERLIASQTNDDTITPHQRRVNAEIARVLCGGDGVAREVPEQHLLDLERRYFLDLVQTPLTQARFAHLRNTGTALRN
jgi:3-hydroxyacyl-CoA dehydrogenase